MTAAPPAGRYDPLAPYRGQCRSCRADVLWAVTANDDRMPVNPPPTARGNVILTIEEAQPGKPERLIAGVLNRRQADGARASGVRLYQSHFATCPQAGAHRRARSKTRRWRRP